MFSKFIKTAVIVIIAVIGAFTLLALAAPDVMATGILAGAIVLVAALYTGLLIKRFSSSVKEDEDA